MADAAGKIIRAAADEEIRKLGQWDGEHHYAFNGRHVEHGDVRQIDAVCEAVGERLGVAAANVRKRLYVIGALGAPAVVAYASRADG